VSLWTYSLKDRKAAPFADVQSENRINAAFSPDGRWVAYNVTEGAITSIFVQPFPATGAKYQVSKTTTAHPVWSRDGREIVSQPPGGRWEVQAITTGPRFAFGAPVSIPRAGAIGPGPSGQRNHDVLPDGRMLAVVPAQTQSSESWTRQIQVVLNWFEELRARVPAAN
jgi:hypothetical protein